MTGSASASTETASIAQIARRILKEDAGASKEKRRRKMKYLVEFGLVIEVEADTEEQAELIAWQLANINDATVYVREFE